MATADKNVHPKQLFSLTGAANARAPASKDQDAEEEAVRLVWEQEEFRDDEDHGSRRSEPQRNICCGIGVY